jgi:hypothetical protein
MFPTSTLEQDPIVLDGRVDGISIRLRVAGHLKRRAVDLRHIQRARQSRLDQIFDFDLFVFLQFNAEDQVGQDDVTIKRGAGDVGLDRYGRGDLRAGRRVADSEQRVKTPEAHQV